MATATVRYTGPSGLATPELAPYLEGGAPLPLDHGDRLELPLRIAQGLVKRNDNFTIVDVPEPAKPPATSDDSELEQAPTEPAAGDVELGDDEEPAPAPDADPDPDKESSQ
jgi:hypothetical protein